MKTVSEIQLLLETEQAIPAETTRPLFAEIFNRYGMSWQNALSQRNLTAEQLAIDIQMLELTLYPHLPDAWQTPSLVGLIVSLMVQTALAAHKEQLSTSLKSIYDQIIIVHQQVLTLMPRYGRETALGAEWAVVLNYHPDTPADVHQERLGRTAQTPLRYAVNDLLSTLQAHGAIPACCYRLETIATIQDALHRFKQASEQVDKNATLESLLALAKTQQKLGQKLLEEHAFETAAEVFSRSHLFFNAAHTWVTKEPYFAETSPSTSPFLQGLIKENEHYLQQALGISDNNTVQSWQADEKHRLQLMELRTNIQTQLDAIVKEPIASEMAYYQRAKALRQLSKKLPTDLKTFVEQLINYCIQMLGPAPCRYAIVGYGSLEKQTVTPYSDLEFGILLEDSQGVDTYKNYFRQLTYLLQATIANLGESPIPLSWFNCSFDSVTTMGLWFTGQIPSKVPSLTVIP